MAARAKTKVFVWWLREEQARARLDRHALRARDHPPPHRASASTKLPTS
jgi:hypothetical protein